MLTIKPIIFPYKVIGGRWSPMISAGIRLKGAWSAVQMYVDSGATYTILRARVAEDVGFDYQMGRKIFVQVGDGATIPVFLHDLPLQIGNRQRTAVIGFSAKLGVPFNLLGRLDVFEHFRICFHEKHRTVSFQPLG